MILFQSDYQESADPAVLQALTDINTLQSPGYGEDELSARTRKLIRALCQAPDADIHFFVGGTQSNLTLIASMLRPFEGVISSDLGHINTHEAGAIEATGHKVLALPHTDGKITAAQIRAVYEAHINDVTHEHIVRPAMIYLSHPTELGTLYTRAELGAIHAVAADCGLRLMIDGARLAYGLAADPGVDLPYLASICDAFTIGGTKCGMLFGEAAVLKSAADFPHFSLPHQAARRAAGQGMAAGRTVSGAAGRRPLPGAGRRGQRKGPAHQASLFSQRIFPALRYPDQPDFPHPAKQRAPKAAAILSVCFLDRCGPRPHRRTDLCRRDPRRRKMLRHCWTPWKPYSGFIPAFSRLFSKKNGKSQN